MSKDSDDSASDYSDLNSFHSDEEEEEDIDDYKKGGYHPVLIGDRFDNGRYIVVRKLGWGHFSTVWLALDTLPQPFDRTNVHVALKIVKSANRYTDSALEEIKLLECVKKTNPESRGYQHVAQLLNHFWHHGPHGKHACMTFEVLGESLLSLMKRYNYKGIPQPIVKRIAKQVLEGLDYLHRECGIVHTDLKPENVLVWIPHIEDYLKQDTAQVLQEIRRHEAPTLPPAPSQSWLADVDTQGLSKSQKKRLKKKRKQKVLAEARQEPDAVDSNGLSDKLGQLAIQQSTREPKVMPSSILDITLIMNGIEAFDDIVVKIADLGNACWMDGEYTHVIQTRQYRSPEVIVGAKWTNKADMWSAACMIFELLTGEFLFDPRAGSKYNKDDDHLAQILELMRTVPKILISGGEFSREFFDRSGKLKHIKKLRYRRLRDVLHDTFLMPPKDADEVSGFLSPMLEMDMAKRASASIMLEHPWLQEV
ncbi:kinase-like domain-containing protein [Gilbertella persicaria]|uniref:non-specific serine/threonine protein kinase n=1 Tax=Rhizopus stolonifer TaxID=4846 RepID=A0A367KXQ0_RHIST|nr:kinase-like domain-containing protein [Gilbertella persicaria]KAI8084322.1 kinase-like domain-containing protein [Gilbertella persicaria]RCI06981.1 serine/threonine protein kinase, CMGC group [Rhizopus stolonifer]